MGAPSNAPPLIQLPSQDRVAGGEGAGLMILAQAASEHFHVSVQSVGVVKDEAFRHQRQTRRIFLQEIEVGDDQVLEQSEQLGIQIALLAGGVADQVAPEKKRSD